MIRSGANDPTFPTFFLLHFEAGGARRPPGPPFDEVAQIYWYQWIGMVTTLWNLQIFFENVETKKVFFEKKIKK